MRGIYTVTTLSLWKTPSQLPSNWLPKILSTFEATVTKSYAQFFGHIEECITHLERKRKINQEQGK